MTNVLKFVSEKMNIEINVFAFQNEDNTYCIYYRDNKGRERKYNKKVINSDHASSIMGQLERKYGHSIDTSFMTFNDKTVNSNPKLQEMLTETSCL